jgi:hypothetical protein
MHTWRYYGPVIAGFGAGFFFGFLLAGEGVIPYSALTKTIALVCALVFVIAGQMMARPKSPPKPPETTA